MFEPKTHNSFMLCLFALAMLVMSGVVIQVIIENWAKRDDLEQNVAERSKKIMDLEQALYTLEAKQATSDFRAEIEQNKLSLLETQKHVLLASLRNLRSAERVAAAELESVEKEFNTYQSKTRNMIWSDSVGYRLGTLTIEKDRTYKGARIAEISEHGVTIIHDGGTSFIRSNNMPASLQEKFQLLLTKACCACADHQCIIHAQ